MGMRITRRAIFRILTGVASTPFAKSFASVSSLSARDVNVLAARAAPDNLLAQATSRRPVQPQAVRTFRIPGADLRLPVTQLFDEFRVSLKSNVAYPISRIFSILPINVITAGAADRLIQRGTLAVSSGRVTNAGDPIAVEFGDQNLGRLEVLFPAQFNARATSGGKSFTLDLSAAPIPVELTDVEDRWKIGAAQSLTSIRFTPTVVSFFLFERIDPLNRLRIDLDMNLQAAKPRPASSYSQPRFMRVANMVLLADDDDDTFVGPFKCKCCGGKSANSKPSYVLELRAKCIIQNGSRFTAVYDG
jgi:hypothetical protein